MENSYDLKEKVWLRLDGVDYEVVIVAFKKKDLALVVHAETPFESSQLTVHKSLLEKQGTKKKNRDIIIGNGGDLED